MRLGRVDRSVLGVCALAACWCLATLVFAIGYAIVHGSVFEGPYAALFAGDQLRYLAWIRDAGVHGLIADPYRAGAPHAYLQPLFVISGLLWRAGLSIQAAYLVWTPVALLTLIWGYASFTRRFFSGREWAAALALALLFFSPLVPLFDYGGIVDANGANYLVIAAGHGAPYWQAWGFLPTVIALGLMPLFLLGIMRGESRPRAVAGTAIAGLLVAWLHPWGGLELLLMLAGLAVLRWRGRAHFRPSLASLVIPGVAVAGPLIYYAVLPGIDPAWSLSDLREGSSGPVWPVLVAYVPLLLFALPGLRRRPRSVLEQLVVLWLGAVVITYLVLPDSREVALEGASLPLSILAVRGWRKLGLRRAWSWAALALAILPGAFYSAHTFHDIFYSHDYPFTLRADEQRAVDSLQGERGEVLATPYLAGALPALAGLLSGQVAAASDALMEGRVGAAMLRRLVERLRVSVVLSDCLPGRVDLSAELAPLGFVERRYGCAREWLRPPGART